jgi:hypothetical protein
MTPEVQGNGPVVFGKIGQQRGSQASIIGKPMKQDEWKTCPFLTIIDLYIRYTNFWHLKELL